jgi:hypothetical protein
MTSVTPPRARSALVSGVVLALLGGAVGCDSGDDLGDHKEAPTSSRATEAPPVTTVTTLHAAGEKLDEAHRARLKAGVNEAVDPWFEGAYLGDFPRSDWSAAFAGFTKDAAADAEGRDLDLLTNAGIATQIDSATAIRRRVRLDVFAYKGHPHGATAHVVLEFKTAGDVAESMSVRGDLYMVKEKGQWHIFGYDVDQAEPL